MTSYEEKYRWRLRSYLDHFAFSDPDELSIINLILVSDLQKLYEHYYKNDEKELLVPYSYSTVHDVAVHKWKSNYMLRYRWNVEAGSRYAEFVAGSYEIIDCIPKGTYFDRLGGPSGNYVCQVPASGIPYTVSQRALPYYFFEINIQDEWTYHRYVTMYDITMEALLDKLSAFSKSDQFVLRTQLTEKQIVKGTIANVESFGEQGAGGGIQYLLPVNVDSLLKMGAIKEV